jgi:nanoRNase/pAp phosphatase (c-di-AMP/oligoRNAs hydrolase)
LGSGWALLNFLMDSRTGLGRFRSFRISNCELMMQHIDACMEHQDVRQILVLPDVAERVIVTTISIRSSSSSCDASVGRSTTSWSWTCAARRRYTRGTDSSSTPLFPASRISVHVIWGKQKLNTVLAVGKSILDRASPVDVGSVMLRYGGGGHLAAGTCQVPHDEAERVLAEVVSSISTPRVLVL